MLVPGVGAQGGSIEAVLDAGPATAQPAGGGVGGGLLVNVSRGIAGAAVDAPAAGASTDTLERLAEAARAWSRRLPVLTLPPAGPADPPRAER
jgi:orotidine-5'-phosphate decarboxylase